MTVNLQNASSIIPYNKEGIISNSEAAILINSTGSSKAIYVQRLLISNIDGSNDLTVTVKRRNNSSGATDDGEISAINTPIDIGSSIVIISSKFWLLENQEIRVVGSAATGLSYSLDYLELS